MKVSSIILAAGISKRFECDTPKCLYPIIRKPMICYLLDKINKFFDDNYLVIKHKENLFKEFFSDSVYNLKIVKQEKDNAIFGIYSGFLNSFGSDYLFIIPGDKILINDDILKNMLNVHLNKKSDVTILTTFDKNNYEYLRIKNNSLVYYDDLSMYEKMTLDIYTSVFVINRSTLNEVFDSTIFDNNPNLSIKDLISFLFLKNYNINTYHTNDAFLCYGINTFYDLSIVENYLRMETNKSHMLNGVCLLNPETITISNDVQIHKGTIIYPNTYITGKTIIKENVIIGPNSELHNVIIGKNSIIKHSLIYDSIIGDNCKIGPFAHLRMNNILNNNIRIGNFVELKATTIDDNTKASHLSYCGDSIIGKNVNIGCGSITVNYDGKNKYQTKIGDNVFIGCNTNMIAPIVIEDNALIAAGSTIYENVPKNSLSIARTYQINKEGYALKYPHIKNISLKNNS